MTPDFPPNPRAELEAKVTAWLLGELSASEAASVRELVEKDAELGRLRERLSQTLNLLRETAATPVGETPAQPARMKLSPEKREKLLASFKTIAPKEFAEPPRKIFTWPIILASAASIMLLVYISIPNFVRARTTSQKNAIINNLRFFDSAKQQWALEQRQSSTATPTLNDLRPYFGHGGEGELPTVAGEKYHLGPVGQPPIALYKDKVITLPEAEGSTLAMNEPRPAAPAPVYASAPPSSTLDQSRGRREIDSLSTASQPQDQEKTALAPTPTAAIGGLGGQPTFDFRLQNRDRSTFQESLKTVQSAAASAKRPHAGELLEQKEDFAMLTPPAASPAPATPAPATSTSAPAWAAQLRASSGWVESNYRKTKTEGHGNADLKKADSLGLNGPIGGKLSIDADASLAHPALLVPVPQAEVLTRSNAFTTFSLNVSDVAFNLAAASLEIGQMPDPASMRSEEFINAFDYRDPEPAPGAPLGFAWERAADPFAQGRDLLRFSIKTAAQGRDAGRPLNLVLLLDKSGSMERADRVEIIANALRVLASQLQPHDTLSVVVFARTARLFIDGAPGNDAGKIAKQLRDLAPDGGTNLEEAMKLAYATALRHYLANGENRVVLLTDGAANLGNVEPEALKKSVASNRTQGIALDCFGVGWDGYNDDLLEKLSRAGGGRYGFINTPEEAATEFAGKLAGALRVAAADVKVQVEFNPDRVTAYRQIGYAKDQLKKEDFRDNNVRAASIGASESGNALYAVQINPAGEGPLCTVHVRFRVPGTGDYQEHEWMVPYDGSAVPLESAAPSMRLAATAAAFSEWLSGSPYAAGVTPDQLLHYLSGVPRIYGADPRPAKLEWMLRQAKSISGK